MSEFNITGLFNVSIFSHRPWLWKAWKKMEFKRFIWWWSKYLVKSVYVFILILEDFLYTFWRTINDVLKSKKESLNYRIYFLCFLMKSFYMANTTNFYSPYTFFFKQIFDDMPLFIIVFIFLFMIFLWLTEPI